MASKMSTKPKSPPDIIALVVFGDLNREEFSRLKPLVNLLLAQPFTTQVVFVPIAERIRELGFKAWAEWGRSKGWKAILFLPFVRAADLPWIGPGQMEEFPVYFLGNLGTQDMAPMAAALLEFLEPHLTPGTDAGQGNLIFDLLKHQPKAGQSPSEPLWLTVRGDADLIDRVPYVFQSLKIFQEPPEPAPQILTQDLVSHLKHELFEKELTIKRLLRSEKRYKKFFEDDITGDFVMDTNWRVVDCNRSFARIFGFPSIDYALGYDCRQLFPNREGRRKTLQTFLQLNYLDYYEIELIRPDGQAVHIIGNLLGIKNDEGQLTQIRGFLFDNTPRKNLEKQLRESQKMEGLGRLAGGIAHDFNNLLTVINGYTELLIAEMPDDSPHLGELGEILHAGLRAAELTSQLLAFSRRQVLTPKVHQLNTIVSSLENMLRRLMNDRIRFTIEPHSGLPPMKADKGQLEQVVMNLVLNARDAMPQGGDLIIRTNSVVIDTTTYSGGEFILPGSYVLLQVIDTGMGMDDETKKRIFEPFFTTKEQGKGTGLGLAMVYGIVQQSGGYLTVESEVGKGTTFSIYFTAHISPEEEVKHPAEEHVPAPRGTYEKIILVEDEDMVRDYTHRILARYGYKVKDFSHGREALDYLQSTGETWDLVLTDVVMPVMTGPELAAQLRATGRHWRVLFMSGYTDDEILRHGLTANQVSFIHKPFKSKEILARVREILDQPPDAGLG